MPLPAMILLLLGIALNTVYILEIAPPRYGSAMTLVGVVLIVLGLLWWQIAKRRGPH